MTSISRKKQRAEVAACVITFVLLPKDERILIIIGQTVGVAV